MGNKSFRVTMVSWKLYASPEDAEVGELNQLLTTCLSVDPLGKLII